MKKQVLIFLSIIFTSLCFGQTKEVIMTVNDKGVTQSEFLQIYLKNNNNPKYDKATLDEYMDLFVKFKLKVAEAEALGYDTLPRLTKELLGYRKQLSTPYLTDSSMSEALVKEAYDRTLNEVKASHILVQIGQRPSQKDTTVAYERIMALRKRILAGEDFAAVAKGPNGSDDPSVKTNGGDLGFFTAFQMVTGFEDAAFNTPMGEVSMPIRTRFGYHIIKVMDRRQAHGTIYASHIMVAVTPNDSKNEKASALKKVSEIHEKLVNGENFEELAKKFSDDPSTNNKSGALPPFGSGSSTRMVANFEEAAFAIQKDGDFSDPILTDYGYHIIKRLSVTPVPEFKDLQKELQNKVNKDERAKKTQASFIKKLKVSYDFQEKNPKRLDYIASKVDTSTFFLGKWSPEDKKLKKVIFTFDNTKVRQSDYAKYLNKRFKYFKGQSPSGFVNNEYEEFVNTTILKYEDAILEKKHASFKALMSEYHDGILLYEIMSDKVWNMAVKDTSGLRTFYDTSKGKYMWKQRMDAMVYICQNQNIADQVSAMLQNDTITSTHVLNKINKESELNLSVKTNKFEIESTPFLVGRDLKVGNNPSYVYDEKYYVVKVNKVLATEAKKLSESKGLITSDYQTYLEEEWLKTLTQKHKIVINNEVLYNLDK